MLLTVFTPTYNRVNTLSRLFESLNKQNFNDFEWLIVDDGSTDNTTELIKIFKEKADFCIRYYKKENGGKHTAHNKALELAKGELFFTVDSDDWLPEDCFEKLQEYAHKVLSQPKSVGIVGLKAYGDGKIIGRSFPEVMADSSFENLDRTGNGGERSLVFKTEVIRQYPFPIIEGEKFVTEAVVYDKIDRYQGFIICNEIFTICEYQIDGLSSNPRKIMAKNPTGFMMWFSGRIDRKQPQLKRVGYILKYHAMRALIKGRKPEKYNGRHKLLVTAFAPFSYCVARHYKKHLD